MKAVASKAPVSLVLEEQPARRARDRKHVKMNVITRFDIGIIVSQT
jgi:hypothetical protein